MLLMDFGVVMLKLTMQWESSTPGSFFHHLVLMWKFTQQESGQVHFIEVLNLAVFRPMLHRAFCLKASYLTPLPFDWYASLNDMWNFSSGWKFPDLCGLPPNIPVPYWVMWARNSAVIYPTALVSAHTLCTSHADVLTWKPPVSHANESNQSRFQTNVTQKSRLRLLLDTVCTF